MSAYCGRSTHPQCFPQVEGAPKDGIRNQDGKGPLFHDYAIDKELFPQAASAQRVSHDLLFSCFWISLRKHGFGLGEAFYRAQHFIGSELLFQARCHLFRQRRLGICLAKIAIHERHPVHVHLIERLETADSTEGVFDAGVERRGRDLLAAGMDRQ